MSKLSVHDFNECLSFSQAEKQSVSQTIHLYLPAISQLVSLSFRLAHQIKNQIVTGVMEVYQEKSSWQLLHFHVHHTAHPWCLADGHTGPVGKQIDITYRSDIILHHHCEIRPSKDHYKSGRNELFVVLAWGDLPQWQNTERNFLYIVLIERTCCSHICEDFPLSLQFYIY